MRDAVKGRRWSKRVEALLPSVFRPETHFVRRREVGRVGRFPDEGRLPEILGVAASTRGEITSKTETGAEVEGRAFSGSPRSS